MSSDDDVMSGKSASGSSDYDRSARFSRNSDDDRSPSQCKKSHCDEEEERDFEKDHCRFLETDQPPEVDQDSIGMMKIDREAALKIDVHKCMVRLNEMSKVLQAIMHLQAQHKNEKRRRQDSDTESDRKRPAPCTPPKRGGTLVHDSAFELDDADGDPGPDEYDDNDLVSSSKTPRKKIRLQWHLIGTKQKSQYSTDDIDRWLAASADAEMIKAGLIEEKHSRSGRMAPSLGGFKLAHVSYRIRISYLFPLNWYYFS
jgi:hypothetical protein